MPGSSQKPPNDTRTGTNAKAITSIGDKERREILIKVNAVSGPDLYEKANLDKYDWYLGMLNRKDIEPYLINFGDFAVRASHQVNCCELVLSVRATSTFIHLTLIFSSKIKPGWSLSPSRNENAKVFPTIYELVEYYKIHYLPIPEPNTKLLLKNPCKRPKWILKRENLQIDMSKLLGAGNFCDVYLAKLNGRRTVAAKICHLIARDDKTSEEQIGREFMASEALINEGQLMVQIRHLNVITFYGMCFDKLPVVVVMEYCPGGSLLSHLLKILNNITLAERLKYSIEAAEGMSYLHDMNLIHRDLAARNCLISQHGIIKIADFGLSKIMSGALSELSMGKQQIPVRWMAPESLTHEPNFSLKSDVWAFGMLLFEIFTNGSKPWADWENKKIATNIRRAIMPDFPEKAPVVLRDLVKTKIWQLDKSKRPDMRFILSELQKLQLSNPIESMESLTINLIEGVKALRQEEVRVLFNDDTEDAFKEIVASSGKDSVDKKKYPTSKEELVNLRDVSIEYTGPTPNVTPPSPKKRRRSGKPKTPRIKSPDKTKQLSESVDTAQRKSEDANSFKKKERK